MTTDTTQPAETDARFADLPARPGKIVVCT